jgi:hypothetical protein
MRREFESHNYAYWLFHPFQNWKATQSATTLALELASDNLARNSKFEEYEKANIEALERIKATLNTARSTIAELGANLKAKAIENESMKIVIDNLNDEMADFRKNPPPLSIAERREMKDVRKENFLLKQQLKLPIEESQVFKAMREELLALVANKDTQINLMQDVLEKQMKKCESSVKDCELLFAKLREVAKRVAFLENEVIIPMYHALDKFGDEGLKIIERRAEARAALSQSSGGDK